MTELTAQDQVPRVDTALASYLSVYFVLSLFTTTTGLLQWACAIGASIVGWILDSFLDDLANRPPRRAVQFDDNEMPIVEIVKESADRGSEGVRKW